MTSSISWLDHDAGAAERSLRLLSFLKQSESRDELGIGGVRDAISDQLFPGTSTIQTRLRYMFCIPWLFGQLDERAVTADRFPGRAREAEIALLHALLQTTGPEVSGVIGRDAGSDLKRMPSSVYWAGLRTWGLRSFDGTISQYCAQADQRQLRRRVRQKQDGEDSHGHAAAVPAWHLQLARLRPEGFPVGATLNLTKSEAHFLLDQWKLNHPRALITWLAMDLANNQPWVDAERIWLHPRAAQFPSVLRDLVEEARRLDALVMGAAILYNLLLAQLDGRDELIAKYEADLSLWEQDEAPRCHEWDLPAFWHKVLGKGHSITSSTQTFLESWLSLVRANRSGMATSEPARQLIEAREKGLKQAVSRFNNRAALTQWGGAAGLVPLNFRWPVASGFLAEWHQGWSAA